MHMVHIGFWKIRVIVYINNSARIPIVLIRYTSLLLKYYTDVYLTILIVYLDTT